MRIFLVTSLVFVVGLALSACGGGTSETAFVNDTGGSGGSGGSGGTNFRLWVTDAPFPIEFVKSAEVVIQEVRLHERDGDAWQTVFEGSETVDLVPLTGGVASLLVGADIPSGTYDQVRLLVDAGEVELEDTAVVDGDSHVFSTANGNLKFPSGSQTGIKVNLDTDLVVVSGLTSDLTLDFDLSKNFVFNGPFTHAPGVKRVIFTPVVKAINSTTAGTVAVEVWSDNASPGDTADDAALEGATVTAFDENGDEAGSGFTGDDGTLTLQLPAGTYTVEVGAPGHDTMTSDPAEVFLANLTDLGVVLLAATSGEVRGTVFGDVGTPDTGDDLVLEGATVAAVLQGETTPAATTTTDNQGAFRFESLPAGTYDLDVSAAGHRDGTVAGVVPTVTGVTATITLEALTENLTGTVSDVDGAPLGGIDVSAENAAGDVVGTATTAADGTYSMSLPTGTYTVTFTDPDDTSITSERTVDIVGEDPESDKILDVTLGM